MVMPCQVSGQAVATNSLKLPQASGVGGAAGAGSAVGRSATGSACATHTIALITAKARTEFFTVVLFPEMLNGYHCLNSLYSIIYSTDRKAHSHRVWDIKRGGV